jgi:hypothetical protein
MTERPKKDTPGDQASVDPSLPEETGDFKPELPPLPGASEVKKRDSKRGPTSEIEPLQIVEVSSIAPPPLPDDGDLDEGEPLDESNGLKSTQTSEHVDINNYEQEAARYEAEALRYEQLAKQIEAESTSIEVAEALDRLEEADVVEESAPEEAEAKEAEAKEAEAKEAEAKEAEAKEADNDPLLMLPPRTIPWHKLDYRASMLLSRVDGIRRRSEVVAGCGLDEEAANRLLEQLIAEQFIFVKR